MLTIAKRTEYHPRMPPDSRKLTAVLFSDIVGYSSQMDADEARTLDRLKEHNRIFNEHIARHHGRVVKTIGDAFMVEFSSAVAAVACGLSVQKALDAYNARQPSEQPIRVRMGVHVGDVVHQDGDLFGDTVNIASRLEPKAPPGTVCISESVFLQVRRKVHAEGEDLGEHELKNIAQPLRLFALTPSDRKLDGSTRVTPAARPGAQRKTTFWVALGVVAAAGLAVAIWALRKTRDKAKPVRKRPAAATTPSIPRGGTLKVGLRYTRGTLDLYGGVNTLSRLAISLAIEPLVLPKPDGEMRPWLVSRWREREGGRKLDLYLRPGVYFHDHFCFPKKKGRLAENRDLVYSLEQAIRHRALDLPILGLATFLSSADKHLRGIENTPNGPVTVTLSHRSPFALTNLGRIPLIPDSLHKCENLRKLKQPVGTGPFRFTSTPDGESFTLKRAPRYWGRSRTGASLPFLDEVVLRYTRDTRSALQRIKDGELHVLFLSNDDISELLDDPESPRPSLKPSYKALNARVGMIRGEGGASIFGVMFLKGSKAFRSPKVRRAVGFAMDRSKLVTKFKRGLHPLGRMLLPRFLGHDPRTAGFKHDLDRARKLLASAGHPKGRGLPIIMLAVPTDLMQLGKAIAAQLSQIDLNVKTAEMTLANLETAIKEKHVDALVGGFAMDTRGTEPYPFLPQLLAFVDRHGYPDLRVSKLMEKILSECDRKKRSDLYGHVERILLENPSIVPIGYPRSSTRGYTLVSNRVGNLVDPTTGLITLIPTRFLSRVYLRSTRNARSMGRPGPIHHKP